MSRQRATPRLSWGPVSGPPPHRMDVQLVAAVFGLLCITASSTGVLTEWSQVPVLVQTSSQHPTVRANSNGNGNYTVSFVPLISLIANFLPRIFNRLGSARPTTVQQARMWETDTNDVGTGTECKHSIWPDLLSAAHFYSCTLKHPCPTSNPVIIEGSCYVIDHHKCAESKVFSRRLMQCVPVGPMVSAPPRHKKLLHKVQTPILTDF